MLHFSSLLFNMNQKSFIPMAARSMALPLLLFHLIANAQTQSQPVLHCEVTYAGTTQQIDTRLHNDVTGDAKAGTAVDTKVDTYGAYINEASDIGGRFRFKAILLGTNQHLDAIKIYAYYETDSQPVLLSEVRYIAPFTYSAAPNSLTGMTYLYSPPLGRELQYGCALQKEGS